MMAVQGKRETCAVSIQPVGSCRMAGGRWPPQYFSGTFFSFFFFGLAKNGALDRRRAGGAGQVSPGRAFQRSDDAGPSFLDLP